LTLKGLETDTLYLVFKDRFPNCLLDCLTEDSNCPQANGDIKQPTKSCQATNVSKSTLSLETKKAPHSPFNLAEESGTILVPLV
jgi:hypothetical protein